MKKVTILILISGLVLSMSCKKNSSDSNNAIFSASMKCKVNGATWISVIRGSTRQGNTLLINGTSSLPTDLLNITILGINAGTYNLNPLAAQVQFSATFTNSTSTTDSLYTAFYGTVTLSSVDTVNKKVSGSFSFDSRNTLLKNKKVTEGTFTNLKYL